MTGKTHMMIGTAAGIIAFLNYPTQNGLVIIGASIFGSLVPDIDHPKSKFNQKILPIKNKFFRVIVYLLLGLGLCYISKEKNNQVFILLGITLVITSLSHHRGFTHSLLGLICFSSIVYMAVIEYVPELYIGFVFGYISHLIADFTTKNGIEIFYPWGKNLSFLITIKTGGFLEKLIFWSLGICIVYVIIKYMTLVPK